MSESISDGTTPLDPNETEGLIVSSIFTRGELDAFEYANILKAEEWVKNQRQPDILTVDFAKLLHEKMFGEVWKWAGQYRKSEKNIGIDPRQISVQMKLLFDNIKFQKENKTYQPDEIAFRFHHLLVYIHAFSNGNGRHARLLTDVILEQELGGERFSWGQTNLINLSETRAQYITALRKADGGDYMMLREFVRK